MSSSSTSKSQPSKQHQDVSDYYKPLFSHEKSLKTNICCLPKQKLSESKRQIREVASKIHPDILADTFGCGSPIPDCISGCHILDLGCGSGRDVFCCAALVNYGQKEGSSEPGRVVGLDMTPEALEKARKYTQYHRDTFGISKDCAIEFQEGIIEELSPHFDKESFDVVISNCVVNLSPDKRKVFQEVYRSLKQGGELYFSDVYADRRVPPHLQEDKELWGECLSGALYWNDFVNLMREVGFRDVRIVDCTQIALKGTTGEEDKEIRENEQVTSIGFYSITVRAFKIMDSESEELSALEYTQEDYNQQATYTGDQKQLEFDVNHTFPQGKPVSISRNTAKILQTSRYASQFQITEPKQHMGEFLSGKTAWEIIRSEQEKQEGANSSNGGGSCCGGGSSSKDTSSKKTKESSSCCGGETSSKTKNSSCCSGGGAGAKKSCC